MKAYYPTCFRYADASIFRIWYTNDIDGFVSQSNRVLYWRTEAEMRQYCADMGISLETVLSDYDIAAMQAWCVSGSRMVDAAALLNFWNFASDYANTLGAFWGDGEEASALYDKLFHANNLLSINTSGKLYMPTWT